MDKFLIAPINEGIRSDAEPFLIPDEAYVELDNVYNFRGRIRKRFGGTPLNTTVAARYQQLYTRLRLLLTPDGTNINTTDAAGDANGIVPGGYYAVGQQFVVGTATYTVASALPGAQAMTATVGAGTFDITTGAYVIHATIVNAATIVYFYASNLGIGHTDNTGHAQGTVPGTYFHSGQMFSVVNDMYTTISDVAGPQAMRATTGTGTYNVTTGAYVINNAPANALVYFYPAQPVMGFCTYETGTVNNNPVIAFDQQFAYLFLNGAWDRLGTAAWTGSDSQFFWGTTWQSNDSSENYLYVTNNRAVDHIKYWTGIVWANLYPQTRNAANYFLETARILVVFKGRVLALNTTETEGAAGAYKVHANRVRWSQSGSPVQADAWQEDIPGKGGWLDAPTRQAIITAQILKDRLIVYFDSSTWELVYLNNEATPFAWYQINSELGAEATFSQIPFDKVVLGIGNTGIVACNGSQVERIDDKIPMDVFKIHANNDGTLRVHGIRDFYTEMVYWTIVYPSYMQRTTYKYPNRILAYNYKNNTWAYNDDSITCFGYYEQQDARTWGNMDVQWSDVTDTWEAGALANKPKIIIAGNQQGFTFLVDDDNPRNSIALSIADIDDTNYLVTCINHNLRDEDFVLIENCQGIVALNNHIFQIVVIDDDHFGIITDIAIAPAYTGGGTITRVSRINILTKQYNFYLKEGRNAYVHKVDFQVDNEPMGQVNVECYPSYSDISLVADGITTGTEIGNSNLDLSPYTDSTGTQIIPMESFQKQFWHPIYFQAEGESVQLRITLTDAQMLNYRYALSDFTLNAFVVYAMPTTSRFF